MATAKDSTTPTIWFVGLPTSTPEDRARCLEKFLERQDIGQGWDGAELLPIYRWIQSRKNPAKDEAMIRAKIGTALQNARYRDEHGTATRTFLNMLLRMQDGDIVVVRDGEHPAAIGCLHDPVYKEIGSGFNHRLGRVDWLVDRISDPSLSTVKLSVRRYQGIAEIRKDRELILDLLVGAAARKPPTSSASASLSGTKKSSTRATPFHLPDEIDDPRKSYFEGAKQAVVVNRYERSGQAREACLRHFRKRRGGRTICEVCKFDFAKVYGELGEGYIHVHHTTPLKSIGKEYIPNPSEDLVPVCPNCHAMLHMQEPPLTVEELRELFRERRRRD